MKAATWTQDTLERLVADAVPEDLHMEYKSAEALKDRGKIAKSISSMANSDGGVVIYGMAEPSGDKGPVQLRPFDPKEYSKERMEQIINTNISPSIKGLVIHVVKIEGVSQGQCFVVEVPKSDTIHQASDQRYYRRRNFMSEPMEDYEIREAFFRQTHPSVDAVISIVHEGSERAFITIQVTNIGAQMVEKFGVQVNAPYVLGGWLFQVYAPCDYEGPDRWQITVPQDSLGDRPLFPGQTRLLRIWLQAASALDLENRVHTREKVHCTLFADDMPAKEVAFSAVNFMPGDTHHLR